MDPALIRSKWTLSQEDSLKSLVNHYQKYQNPLQISWSKISFELNRDTYCPKGFKTDKQCKEHWNNHLNPFVNKSKKKISRCIYLYFYYILSQK